VVPFGAVDPVRPRESPVRHEDVLDHVGGNAAVLDGDGVALAVVLHADVDDDRPAPGRLAAGGLLADVDADHTWSGQQFVLDASFDRPDRRTHVLVQVGHVDLREVLTSMKHAW
jgi:hypothetical protein